MGLKNERTVIRTCPLCGESGYIDVAVDSMNAYIQREKLIQDAFPDLNPLEREFIKSGYCPECQSVLFGTNLTSENIKMEGGV